MMGAVLEEFRVEKQGCWLLFHLFSSLEEVVQTPFHHLSSYPLEWYVSIPLKTLFELVVETSPVTSVSFRYNARALLG